MNEAQDNHVVRRAIDANRTNKAVEHLLGLVSGIVADAHLHDLEIQFLSTWLSGNPDVTAAWPGSVVAAKVRDVLADGHITEEERSHLLSVLTELVGTNFADTGSADAEVTSLPLDESSPVHVRGRSVCHTGDFLFGTRTACERMTEQAGGLSAANVSGKVHLLVVGTRVAPNWAHTSYGRKIQKACDLQLAGHPIQVVSERRWLAAIESGQ